MLPYQRPTQWTSAKHFGHMERPILRVTDFYDAANMEETKDEGEELCESPFCKQGCARFDAHKLMHHRIASDFVHVKQGARTSRRRAGDGAVHAEAITKN